MTNGILLIDKESGISSAKCVYMLRKKLSIKKIGHAGTLDPLATGLLPLLIGKATRVSNFLMDEVKVYETLAFFGEKTDSQDKTGKIIAKSSNLFSKKDLEMTIQGKFIGDIEQIPPMYSALKYNGRKLYELAREGKNVERKKRNIKIYDFEILSFDFPFARFKITCSKGTYIRTLVNDLGEELKTFANVHELRRIKVGDFHIKDSIKSENLENIPMVKIKEKIIPIDKALLNMDKIILDKSNLKKSINGMTIKLANKNDIENIRVYVEDEFIGIGKISNNALKLKRVFYEG
ncbi:tRNA pseudouridine(55) synthase TruB [Anaerococcus sp. AGMB00486]|uniref:tRNA pseudouridine synthase B n=1 Tax=Anaerococcus faecalis TaxID=2742993 RepID=A0ABX2N8E9_9FIRM|nr:tRNA pseudouridine(55) synthase TruB [Anaerococcus faecalis]NVF10958.1 tRNA pseudouridine(55) synthase TruB [Anaerococcus faecalis]